MSEHIQWGIGIEHEVLMINQKKVKVKVSTLLANLDKESYGLETYINNFILPKCSYEVTI